MKIIGGRNMPYERVQVYQCGTRYGAPLEWLQEVIANPTDDCQIWPFSCGPDGYGSMRFEGRTRKAHRVALFLSTKEDPKGMYAAHGPCGNRLCVNPKHLSWKTPVGNSRDRHRDGTIGFKLSPDKVEEIRAKHGRHVDIAAEFGVSKSTVTAIKSGRIWKPEHAMEGLGHV